MLLFRFGHPPLLVPWSALGPIEEKSALFGLSRYHSIPIYLPDGSDGVDLYLHNYRVVEAIASYQQVDMLGK